MKFLTLILMLLSLDLHAIIIRDVAESSDFHREMTIKFCLKEYLKIGKGLQDFRDLYPTNSAIVDVKMGEIEEGIFQDLADDVHDELLVAYRNLSTEMIFHDNFTCFCLGRHHELMMNVLDYILSNRASTQQKSALSIEFISIFIHSVLASKDISPKELDEIPEDLHPLLDDLAIFMHESLTELKETGNLDLVRQVAMKCGEAALKFLAPLPEMR